MRTAEEQVREWLKDPPIQPIQIAKQALGSLFLQAVYMKYGYHPIVRIVPYGNSDLSKYAVRLGEELDSIDWQFVTIPDENNAGCDKSTLLRFGMAPITLAEATIVYHTTQTERLGPIFAKGLLPSNPTICHTDFPDTHGKVYVTRSLEGVGSASRWVGIFSKRYGTRPDDYSILQVDLAGVKARIYQDVRSQYGLIVDRIAQIPIDRISFVRHGEAKDLLDS